MADRAAEVDRLLAEVGIASDHIEEARQELKAAVRRARQAGASYGAVASILGVSRQAAWERFREPSGAATASPD